MARGAHAKYRMALEKAVEQGLIRVNPAIGCKLPPKKAKEMIALPQDEVQRFLAQAKEEGFYESFLLELGTGLRIGELLALQWDNINFETGALRINKTAMVVNGELIVADPKNQIIGADNCPAGVPAQCAEGVQENGGRQVAVPIEGE